MSQASDTKREHNRTIFSPAVFDSMSCLWACCVAKLELSDFISLQNTVEPRYFEVPREMEKKFEIAGFRNNRGSVKLVTMNHFLIKYSTV